MRTFYFVPTSTLAATKPRGGWHATEAPGAPQWSLLVVEDWNDVTADEEWEAMPGVRPPLHIENLGAPVPAIAVTAFGPWGVLPTDTVRQALRKIKAFWPHARP